MRVVQVTVAIDGSLSTKVIDLPRFTVGAACKHLGVKINDGDCVMDEVDESQMHYGTFSISLAQDKPWTYIRHVFIKAD